MRVLVSGATGAVGKALVPRLVERGHDVVATTRSPSRAGLVEAMGATPLVLDVLDGTAVGEAVARVQPEVIVHQATALSGTPDLRRFDRWFETTNRLRTEGTGHLLAAAQATGVRRVVAQSYTGWTNARDGGPSKSEDDPLDPEPLPAQHRSIGGDPAPGAGRDRRAGRGHRPSVRQLLRPGCVGGARRLVRRRRFPIVGDGAGVWSWIHVEDAATATIAAVQHGGRGVYNVVDDEPAPVSAWLPALAEAVGAPPPLRVPRWVGRLAAGAVPVRWMTEGRGASNAKIKRALGWEPRWASWRDGFREALGAAAARPA